MATEVSIFHKIVVVFHIAFCYIKQVLHKQIGKIMKIFANVYTVRGLAGYNIQILANDEQGGNDIPVIAIEDYRGEDEWHSFTAFGKPYDINLTLRPDEEFSPLRMVVYPVINGKPDTQRDNGMIVEYITRQTDTKHLSFTMTVSATISLRAEHLSRISEDLAIPVEELTKEDIAHHIVSQTDYKFDFSPEGEAPLLESYSTDLTEIDIN